MPDMSLPRGTRDLMPNEAFFRTVLIEKIERIFRLYGFLVIDTPMLEKLDVLKAKGGIGDDAKLIFEIKDDDCGLRYDQTLSLARYMVMHNEMPLPFKRYSIGRVWRREEPQKMRYREFMQADIDIVGGDEVKADAEVIAAGCSIFDAIGIGYRVDINNRAMTDELFKKLGVNDSLVAQAMRTLDKLDKIGGDKVAEQLVLIGIQKDIVEKIMLIINSNSTNADTLSKIDNILGHKKYSSQLNETIDLIKQYGITGNIVISPWVMRGIDYYTGIVFEIRLQNGSYNTSALGAGGRYDSLIGALGSKSMPAVGMGIGLNRLLDILEYSNSPEYGFTRVLVVPIKQEHYTYALSVAKSLRSAGVETDIAISSRNLKNQLSYASAIKVGHVIIVGDSEVRDKKLMFRDMSNGSENLISIDEAIALIKGN